MTTLPLTLRLTRGITTLLRPMQRRATIAQLSKLDDRLLRDVGLSHIDVEAMRRMW